MLDGAAAEQNIIIHLNNWHLGEAGTTLVMLTGPKKMLREVARPPLISPWVRKRGRSGTTL
eukprot:1529827-Prymnesium_polylepis.1